MVGDGLTGMVTVSEDGDGGKMGVVGCRPGEVDGWGRV